jgi:hypothetical protein
VESSGLIGHEQGNKEGDGWACNTGEHSKNFMVYGPYTTDIPAGNHNAVFRMMTDNNTANNGNVVVIEVHDFYSMEILSARTITRKQFNGTFSYQNFSLGFSTNGNHKLELRVKWLDTAYIKVDRIKITP